MQIKYLYFSFGNIELLLSVLDFLKKCNYFHQNEGFESNRASGHQVRWAKNVPSANTTQPLFSFFPQVRSNFRSQQFACTSNRGKICLIFKLDMMQKEEQPSGHLHCQCNCKVLSMHGRLNSQTTNGHDLLGAYSRATATRIAITIPRLQIPELIWKP